MADQTVKLIITGEDKTQPAISSTQNGLKYLEGTITKLSIQITAFSMAWNAAMQVVRKGMEYIDLGGKAIRAEEAFNAMAESSEVNAGRMVAAMKKAADGFMDDSDLMQKATFAMAQGIDPDKMPQLLEAARVSARKTGMDVGQAVDGMVQAIATNMPRSLRQMGAITKEQMNLLNKAMADGVTEVNLLDLVLANTAVTTAKLGPSANNAAKDIERFKIQIKELEESLGKGLIVGLQKALGVLQAVSAFALGASAAVFKLVQGLYALGAYGAGKVGNTDVAKARQAQADRWGMEATAAGAAGVELAFRSESNMYGSDPKADLRTKAQKDKEVAAAEALRKAAEDKLKAAIASAAAAKKAEEALKSWGTTSLGLSTDIEKSKTDAWLDDLDKKLIDIDKKAQELREKAQALPADKKKPALALISEWQGTEAGGAVAEWHKKYLEEQTKASEAAIQQEDATRKKIELGAKETTEETKKELDRRKDFREADINSQLADLDLEEKLGTAHRDTIAQRISLQEEMAAAQKDYLDNMVKAADPTAWLAQSTALDNTRLKLAELRKEFQGLTLGGALTISLKETGNELMDLFGNVQSAVKKAFSGMTDALTEFVMTGKLNFSDLANSIIKDMIRIMIQQQITGPLAGGAGKFLGSLFASGSGATAGTAGGYGAEAAGALVMHSGGLASEGKSYRIVPSALFASAPRYHSGIGPGEKAAIIRDDEGVFTTGQMKKLAPAGSGAQQVTVKIINSGQPAQASDTKVSFNPQEMVVTVWLDAYQNNKFGLRNAMGG